MQRFASVHETRSSFELRQQLALRTHVGIAREHDWAPWRALRDGLDQLLDLRLASALVGATRTRVEVYVLDVDFYAFGHALPRGSEAFRGQAIEVAIEHAIAFAPRLALQGGE